MTSVAVAEKPRKKAEVALVPSSPAPMTEGERYAAIVGKAMADPTVNMDKLERLCALMEGATARDKEAAFNAAMRAAQSKMGAISADATNDQTRSKYATYAKLDSILRPIYTAEGFALSFNTEPSPIEAHVRVLAYVSHADGHTRTYSADMPNDGKGAKGGAVMTTTHAAGAAIAYGMRYLLKMIFNVAVGEDDRDGNKPNAAANAPKITDKQVIDLQALLTEAALDNQIIFEHFSVQSLADLTVPQFNEIHGKISKKIGKKK